MPVHRHLPGEERIGREGEKEVRWPGRGWYGVEGKGGRERGGG